MYNSLFQNSQLNFFKGFYVVAFFDLKLGWAKNDFFLSVIKINLLPFLWMKGGRLKEVFEGAKYTEVFFVFVFSHGSPETLSQNLFHCSE